MKANKIRSFMKKEEQFFPSPSIHNTGVDGRPPDVAVFISGNIQAPGGPFRSPEKRVVCSFYSFRFESNPVVEKIK